MFRRDRKKKQDKSSKKQTEQTQIPTPNEQGNPPERYAKIADKMAKQFAKPPVTGSLKTPGIIQHVQQIPGGAIIHAANASISVIFYQPNLVEIRMRPDRQFPPVFSYALSETFKFTPQAATVTEDTDTVVIGAGGMACVFTRTTTQLRIYMTNGQEVSVESGFSWLGEKVTWQRQLPADEGCYGLGQRGWGLNLRGRKWALWNFDPVGYGRGTDPVYYSIPFYMGVHPEYAIGVLWDNPARGTVDLGSARANQMAFGADTGELRLYFMADEKPDAVLKHYLDLTGLPPLLPMWAFGYQQSRWGYVPSNKFRELAREFRQRLIPCDVLHFDIDYMDGHRVFTYNKETFGDLPALLSELGKQGFKAVSIVDPAIKVDLDYEAFRDGQERGMFHTYPDGRLFVAPVWAGDSAFPDFTNPTVREWWAGQVENLLKVGFAGLWNDMNEPTVFLPPGPGIVPEYIQANWEGQGNTHLGGAHNVYGMQMARATRTGLERARPDKRQFVLTRAAYAGAQRYTVSWTGDNRSEWDHLRLSISVVLNLGLSGMFFTGPDIGGFMGDCEPEMYARWIQVASLLPFCRTHTCTGTADQEPWSFGPEVEKIARKYIELRYQLLPYLYSTYVQGAQNGVPMIRPTFWDDPSDTRLYNQDDAYMVGDALLVAPILEQGATKRELYLPRGVWYNFWTRKLIDGSRTIELEAPLDQMPIFVRAGRVVPMWPVTQYVGERPIDELQLLAFAGIGETTLYEDAGDGLSYKNGDYRYSYFSTKFLPGGQFAVEWRRAGKYQPAYKKVRLELVGISGDPEMVYVDDQAAPLWFFENSMVEVLSSPFSQVRIVGKSPDASEAAKTVARRPGPSGDQPS